MLFNVIWTRNDDHNHCYLAYVVSADSGDGMDNYLLTHNAGKGVLDTTQQTSLCVCVCVCVCVCAYVCACVCVCRGVGVVCVKHKQLTHNLVNLVKHKQLTQ